MFLTIVISLLVILGVMWVSVFMGRRRFHSLIITEVDELFAHAGSGIDPRQFAVRAEGLPEAVQRYVRYAVVKNASTVRTARLRHGGLFRTNPKGRWLPIKGQEYFAISEPGFIWKATIPLLPFLWIEARDRLINGRGNMFVKFCSLFTLVNASGKELDQGALLRWLADVVWFPIGYVGDRIHWKPIDSSTAQATLTHKGLSVSANLEVDEEGRLLSIHGWRYRVENGRYELARWTGVCSDYRQFGGMRIPTTVEVLWELSGGDFSYAKFNVSAVEYDSGDSNCNWVNGMGKALRGMNYTARKQAAVIFLLGLAAVALYLCYVIAKPFLGPIMIAVMLAIVCYPLHAKIHLLFRSSSLAAAVSTTFVLLIATIPIVLLGISVSSELRALVQSLRDESGSQGGLSPYLAHLGESLVKRLSAYVDLSEIDLHVTFLHWAEQGSRYLLSIGAAAATNLLSFVLDTVVVFFSLFFFFREGKSICHRLSAMLPLNPDQTEKLFTGISETMIANLYGGLAVGAAQGFLTGLSFWVLGLSAPILWALVTGLASLVPVVGSALVWGPATILLILNGHWVKVLILLIWGAAVVGQVDVVVRPYVVSAHVKVHTLLICFALLGGVEAFGIVGIFVGPVILSLTLAVLDMVKRIDFSWWTAPDCGQGVSLNDKPA